MPPQSSVHKITVEKIRICLRCNGEFGSNGPHHRVCQKCENYARSRLDKKLRKSPGNRG